MKRIIPMIIFAMLPAAVSAESKAELQISASRPESGSTQVTVIFRNPSPEPLLVWTLNNSWGWENLSFNLVRNGKPVFIRRRMNPWFSKNGPDFMQVSPNGERRLVIDIKDSSWTSSSPSIKALDPNDVIVVNYSVPDSPDAEMLSVWTGVACGSVERTPEHGDHTEVSRQVVDPPLSEKGRSVRPLVDRFLRDFDRERYIVIPMSSQDEVEIMSNLPSSFADLALAVADNNIAEAEVASLLGKDRDILGMPGIRYFLKNARRIHYVKQDNPTPKGYIPDFWKRYKNMVMYVGCAQ